MGPYEILWQGRRFWGGGFWGFAIRISVLCDSGPSAQCLWRAPLVGVDRGSPVRRRGIWRFERNRWAALWPGYSEV